MDIQGAGDSADLEASKITQHVFRNVRQKQADRLALADAQSEEKISYLINPTINSRVRKCAGVIKEVEKCLVGKFFSLGFEELTKIAGPWIGFHKHQTTKRIWTQMTTDNTAL